MNNRKVLTTLLILTLLFSVTLFTQAKKLSLAEYLAEKYLKN